MVEPGDAAALADLLSQGHPNLRDALDAFVCEQDISELQARMNTVLNVNTDDGHQHFIVDYGMVEQHVRTSVVLLPHCRTSVLP